MIHSLRWRLMLVVAIVVLMAVAFVGLYSSRVARAEFVRVDQVEQEIAQSLPSDDAIRSIAIRHYREHDGWNDWAILLAELKSLIGRGELVLMDADGTFLGSTLPGPGTTTATLEPSGELRIVRRTELSENVMGFTGPSWMIMDEQSGRLGSVHFVPTEGGEVERTRVFMEPVNRSLAWGVIIVGLVALTAMFMISGAMLRPIGELTRAARRMATGELGHRVAVDRTDEIGELAGAFNTMAEGLERLEGVRRDMVNDIAHELRTPLTRVRCQLEAIQDGLVNPRPKTIDSLHGEILLLSRLIDDLQDLSLATAGKLPIHLETVDLTEEIQRAIDAVRGASEPEIPSITIDAAPSLTVRADPRRFQQILRNLVGNAVRHTDSAGSIVISARESGSTVEIAVTDTGTGIDEEHLQLVFERFHRVDPSRSRETGGAGLGLAIVRQLVLAHGGEVGVESEPGRGSRFWLTLPGSVDSADERNEE